MKLILAVVLFGLVGCSSVTKIHLKCEAACENTIEQTKTLEDFSS